MLTYFVRWYTDKHPYLPYHEGNRGNKTTLNSTELNIMCKIKRLKKDERRNRKNKVSKLINERSSVFWQECAEFNANPWKLHGTVCADWVYMYLLTIC